MSIFKNYAIAIIKRFSERFVVALWHFKTMSLKQWALYAGENCVNLISGGSISHISTMLRNWHYTM